MTIKKTLLTTIIAFSLVATSQAQTFWYKTRGLDYVLPDKIREKCQEKDNCPEIKIAYLDSNRAWINTVINKQIDEALKSNAMPSEKTIPKDVTIKQTLDDFLLRQMVDADNQAFHTELSVEPTYIGHLNDFEMLAIHSYVYTGGNHGLPLVFYS